MAFVQMWDPNKRTYVTVNDQFVDKYKSQGLTTKLPTASQTSQFTKDAQAGWRPVVADPTPRQRQGETDPVRPRTPSTPIATPAQPKGTQPVTGTPRVASGSEPPKGDTTQPIQPRPESGISGMSTKELASLYASGNAAAKAEMLKRGAIKVNEQGQEQLVPNWQNIKPGEVSQTAAAGTISLKDLSDEQLQEQARSVLSIGGQPTNENKVLQERGLAPVTSSQRQFTPVSFQGGGQSLSQPVVPQQQQQQSQGDSIEEQLRQRRTQAAVEAFRNAFANTQQSIQEQEAKLAPEFRGQRAQIGVQDTMARAAREKMLAGGGLSMSGARSQSELGQSVLTQGAIGQSRELESGRRGELEAALTRAARERDFGIAGAQSDAEISALESSLEKIRGEEQFAREQQALREERAFQLQQDAIDRAFTLSRDEADRIFTLSRDQAQASTQRERDEFLAAVDQENKLLDAEIAAARDAKDFEREQELLRIKQQNSLTLEAVKQANDMAQINARGEQDRLTKGEEQQQGFTLSVADADKAISQAVSLVQTESGGVPVSGASLKQKAAVADKVVELAASGKIDEETEFKLIERYGLTDADIDNAIKRTIPVGGVR